MTVAAKSLTVLTCLCEYVCEHESRCLSFTLPRVQNDMKLFSSRQMIHSILSSTMVWSCFHWVQGTSWGMPNRKLPSPWKSLIEFKTWSCCHGAEGEKTLSKRWRWRKKKNESCSTFYLHLETYFIFFFDGFCRVEQAEKEQVPNKWRVTGGTKAFCTIYQDNIVGLNVLIHTGDHFDRNYLGVSDLLRAVLILPQPTIQN